MNFSKSLKLRKVLSLILVMTMIYLFFGQQYAAARGMAFEAVLGVILSVVFINGTLEALVAALLAAAVCLAILKANVLRNKRLGRNRR